jgi:hypothetical protein
MPQTNYTPFFPFSQNPKDLVTDFLLFRIVHFLIFPFSDEHVFNFSYTCPHRDYLSFYPSSSASNILTLIPFVFCSISQDIVYLFWIQSEKKEFSYDLPNSSQ